MKKILLMAACAMMTTTMATAQEEQEEQEEEVLAYFTTAEMPDMLRFLPAPPDTIGALFAHDIMQYMWGKTMRLDPERAAIAIRDAEYSLECIIREFSEPFGLQISLPYLLLPTSFIFGITALIEERKWLHDLFILATCVLLWL